MVSGIEATPRKALGCPAAPKTKVRLGEAPITHRDIAAWALPYSAVR